MLYCRKENWPVCAYYSIYLSILLSFQSNFHQLSASIETWIFKNYIHLEFVVEKKTKLMNFINIFLPVCPATKWRMAYSFTLRHMFLRQTMRLSITLYSIVRVSATPPTVFKLLV